MLDLVRKILVEEAGQGLAEYALILMLVALVAIAGLRTLGTSIENAYQQTANGFK